MALRGSLYMVLSAAWHSVGTGEIPAGSTVFITFSRTCFHPS
jgi:hypothetical protein